MGDNVAVGVSSNGDEILKVVGRQCRSVQEEEGLKVGALVYAESGYQLEAAGDGLNEQRAVSERGDGDEVDKVVPGLLVPRGADG